MAERFFWLSKCALWLAVLAVGLFTQAAEARVIKVRSGQHPTFSRLVFADAGQGWSIETVENGYRLHPAESGISFDTKTVFDLIPKSRIHAVRSEPDALLIETQAGQAATGYYHGKVYIIDVADAETPVGTPEPVVERAAQDSITVALPNPAELRSGASDDLRGAGDIATLAPYQAVPPEDAQLGSIESALLFQVARAASDGSLNVTDPDLLKKLRPKATASSGPAPKDADGLDCRAVSALLSFPQEPPRSTAEAEAAFLSRDQERTNQQVIGLVKDFLALGLFEEAGQLLILAPEQDDSVSILRAVSQLLAAEKPATWPFPEIRNCAPVVELWSLALEPSSAIKAAPYDLFTAFMANPPLMRAQLKSLLQRLMGTRDDAAAQTLLGLLAQTPVPCPPDDLCAATEHTDEPMLEAVKTMALAPSEELSGRANRLFSRLLATTQPTEPALTHYLAAIAYERGAEPAGPALRASAILSLGLNGDLGAAFEGYLALPSQEQSSEPASKVLPLLMQKLISDTGDDVFLNLGFRHRDLLEQCCGEPLTGDFTDRLKSYGFDGNSRAKAASESTAAPAAAPHAQGAGMPESVSSPPQETQSPPGTTLDSHAGSGSEAALVDHTDSQRLSMLDQARQLTAEAAQMRQELHDRLNAFKSYPAAPSSQ